MNIRLKHTGAALLAAALVLTACGGDDDDAGPAEPAASDEATATDTTDDTTPESTGDDTAEPSDDQPDLAGTTLTFWIMGDNSGAFEELVAPFTDETGIEVDVEAIPWENVNDRLTTAVASGDGPDVTQIGLSLLPTFLAGEALMDVSGMVADYPNLADSNFPSGVSQAALNPEGTVASFPWVSDTRVLFYRSDVLSEAGYDAPPATWDEIHEVAAALAERGGDEYGYYIPQWDAPLPISYVWQAGGDVIDDTGAIDLQTPEFEAAVDHYLAFHDQGVVPVNSDFDQALGFITGAAPMLVSGPYLEGAIRDQAPELDGAWGVTTVPAGVDNTSLFAGSNVGVWANSEHPEAALELINFLADPQTQLAWYEAVNELPAVTGALDELKAGDSETVSVYADQLANSRLLPLHPQWDAVGSEILNTLNSIALTGADRDTALADLYAAVESMTG
ncbi:MAG: extracellular solute-binding protein [Ilumatobacteraceae bacterium]|nr:extracellular solute-binding protein [Ilumatobacteraceae bacterium]